MVEGEYSQAYAFLSPVLAERTSFRSLDRIGKLVGAAPGPKVADFLEQVAAGRTEGGWVIVGSSLGQQLDRDLEGSFALSRTYIVDANVWFGADILGERVPGPALVEHFEPALRQLAPWREDPNRWVRRAVGVAVHFWGKRSCGASEMTSQAQELLAFLGPMFGEWEMDAAKGVGWGLKTLGRYYPELVTDWLSEQVVDGRRHRALMLRKATTYLPDEQRARLMALLTG
jgi:3-methyladenine DNA glycosylase AlkD